VGGYSSSPLCHPRSLLSPLRGTHSAENIGPLVESERERAGESETNGQRERARA